MPDRPPRPGRRCARLVLALLRDGRTRPDEWARPERAAVTRLHAWAFRHGAEPWPAPHAAALAEAGGNGEPLDAQVNRLAAWIIENVDGEPSRSEGAIDCALRLLAHHYGPDAEDAPCTDPQAHGAQIDALRSEVARLTGLLDDASREADRADNLASLLAERTRRLDVAEREARTCRREQAKLRDALGREQTEREEAVTRAARAEHAERTWRREVDEQTARAEREHAERLRLERLLAAQQETTEFLRGHLDGERARAERAEGLIEPVELYVPIAARVTWDGTKLRALYMHPHHDSAGSEAYTDGKGRPLTIEDMRKEGRAVRVDGRVSVDDLPAVDAVPHEQRNLPPVEEDPRRPHLDSWPDDAVLLTYVELRRLVALHLERYADAGTARAMLEGDVPLRVSEVLT